MTRTTDKPLRIMLVAGEVSGDRFGAQLMSSLRCALTRPISFMGVGGAAMSAQGLNSLHSINDTAVVGIWDVVKRLPLLLRRIRETAEFALHESPDALVLIDSPDFTHRVAKRVRAHNKMVPIIAYVAPSVWAWRRRRATRMRAYIDHIMVLLPFEEEVFRRAKGPACTYVGHPALEEVPTLQDGEAFRKRHDINTDEHVVALLPGSRRGEVERHVDKFVEAGLRLRELTGDVRLVLLGREEVRPLLESKQSNWCGKVLLLFGEEERIGLFGAANAALVAVGTAVLELGLARVPMVVGLREHAFNAYLGARLLRTPSLSLVNLVLDAPATEEYLQEELEKEKVAAALQRILTPPGRERILGHLDEFRAMMSIGSSVPSERAARTVLEIVGDANRSG